MGLLDRISARTVDRRSEQRFSIDSWLADFLLPANEFSYNNHAYPFGLNTTYNADRAKEISNTLPGYMAALRACPPAFGAQLVRASVLSQARFCFRNADWSPKAGRTFTTSALGPLQKPWPNATTGQLINLMEWHHGLAGNAYVTNRTPGRLRVLRPDWVVIMYGSQQQPDDAAHALDGELIGYGYCNGGIAQGRYPVETLLPGEVAHWSAEQDPECAGIGMSWITPAIREIQGDKAATDHKLRFFENGATPNMVVKGINAATKEQFDEFVDMMETRHAGVRNAYRTLYLTTGADATVVGADLRQIDFKATQGAGETRISMLSRVHPVILGASEGLQGSSLNAGNFGAARRLWADTWIYPTLQDLAASLAPMVRVPADAELWTNTKDMPILREDARDAADIQQVHAQTITGLVNTGFTRKSSIAAVEAQDMTLLVEDPNWISVQLQNAAGGSAPALPAGGATPKAHAAPAAERKFNPNEPRRPDGKWGVGGVVSDVLKLADRIKLGEDEHLVGSAKVGDGRGDYSTVMARVDGPGGPRLRFGVVDTSEGTRKWRASNGGATVVLDEHGVGELRRVIADAQARGPKSVADYRADIKARHARGEPESEWPSPEADIAQGIIRGSAWGDIEWTLTREEGPNFSAGGVDYGPGGKWLLSLDVKATDNQLGPLDSFDIYSTGVARKLDSALAGLMDQDEAVRAAGHDTTPGHDQLHHYWVYGEGLAKWAGSPKPWTTLVALLTPHVGPERAKTYASRWFIEHFGFAAGSDLNRVTHGKPPRGNKVGPG